jgi:FlaA1/EpsC-like NDP-sugar epimerase
MTRRVVLVHGAAGALGRAVIKRFRASKPWTIIGVGEFGSVLSGCSNCIA